MHVRTSTMNLPQHPPCTKWSLLAIVAVFVLVAGYRAYKLTPNELSWDAFGYYMYLPATFVHGDPLLKDVTWAKELLQRQPEISGTLYQVSQAPDGSPMYFFLMGMAILYLPFFLLAHGYAAISGQPMDGFSTPYQASLALGFLLYTWIGLVHLRRILRHFFSEGVAAWVIIMVSMGTNWFHFMTVKNLETANALFMLMAVLVWNTMEWHRTQRFQNAAWVAASLAMITLVKPSEVLALLIPVLWGVHDKTTWRMKWALIVRLRAQVLKAISIGMLVLLPQMLYWWVRTGSPIYDSYKNPGVGLDLWSPHLADMLFSFRKGWLLYTPIMAFALFGFLFLWKRRRDLFPVILIWFLAAFWIICSWSEWWYGASYSVRPMITTYVLLSIPLGFCIEAIRSSNIFVRAVLFTLQSALIVFNLFQTWQHHNGVLDPYRTTRDYYFAILGRTEVPPGAEWTKSVERSFTNEYNFADQEHYRRLNIGRYDFEETDTEHAGHYQTDSLLRSRVYRLDQEVQFSPNIRNSYAAITESDHIRVRASVRMFLPSDLQGEPPCLVFTLERKEGSYGYTARSPHVDARGRWVEVVLETIPPPVRDPNDRLICYVWHRSATPILIDDLNVDIYVPR